MDTPQPSPSADSLVPQALAIAAPLVTWLIRSGIGHSELSAALKPVFLAQAQDELIREQQKTTDSALSQLSGLHRKDVRALRESAGNTLSQVRSDGSAWGKPSTANQVATRWLSASDLPQELPMYGEAGSFEALSRSVSKDVHPRTVLQELVRLGMAREDEAGVHLLRGAFVPEPKLREARHLFAGSAADHLQAGVHNLSAVPAGSAPAKKFLEQSVFADGLSPESVQQLNQLANQLWAQVLNQVVEAATALCEKDEGHPEPQRFRLGMFSYAAPETDKTRDGPQP